MFEYKPLLQNIFSSENRVSFNKFQFVRLPLVPNDKCILREDDEICAGGGADGKGTCFGDEGLHDNISGTL